STSGSVKYVVGAPPGPKSRGGVVIVLGGDTGPAGAWAKARRGAPPPAAPPMVFISAGRGIRRPASGSNELWVIDDLLMGRPRAAGCAGWLRDWWSPRPCRSPFPTIAARGPGHGA